MITIFEGDCDDNIWWVILNDYWYAFIDHNSQCYIGLNVKFIEPLNSREGVMILSDKNEKLIIEWGSGRKLGTLFLLVKTTSLEFAEMVETILTISLDHD